MHIDKVKKVLIVDDEEVVRIVLSEFLAVLDYQVDQFTNGIDGLEAMQNSEYSAAFADVRMPGLDGIGFVKQASALHPEVPVIIITGHGTDETCQEAMAAGAYDFLRKPFHLSQIITIMKQIEAATQPNQSN